MRKKILMVGMVIMALLLVGGLVGCSTGAVSGDVLVPASSSGNQPEGIWTTGEGKIYVVPDVAVLTLGIESEEESVAAARENAAVAMEAVIKAIKAQGVDEKDIQTQYFNIYQTTRWNGEKEEVTGFRVTNSVVVKVHEVEKVGDVIDDVVAAGGDLTRINGINFTVDEPQKYYEQARDEAFDYAKAKADQLAAKAGVKLGALTYMTESSANNNYSIMYRNYALAEDAMVPSAASGTPSSISVGQLEISATVSLGYQIMN